MTLVTWNEIKSQVCLGDKNNRTLHLTRLQIGNISFFQHSGHIIAILIICDSHTTATMRGVPFTHIPINDTR